MAAPVGEGGAEDEVVGSRVDLRAEGQVCQAVKVVEEGRQAPLVEEAVRVVAGPLAEACPVDREWASAARASSSTH